MANLSRAELAKLSGLRHDLITRVEQGRMPLRYADAVFWLRALVMESPTRSPVNPLWLVDDKQQMQVRWPLLLPRPEYIGIPYRTRFSEFVADNRKLLEGLAKNPPEGDLPISWIFPYNAQLIMWQGNLRRMERGVAWLRRLWEHSAAQFASKFPLIAQMLRDMEGGQEIRELTERVVSDTVSEMVTLLKLRSELKALTVGYGRKTELANLLGVTRTTVSRWIVGGKEPGGEITLKLLNWVQQQKAKQTNADRAITRSARKTRSTKVGYEKRKSNPSKGKIK